MYLINLISVVSDVFLAAFSSPSHSSSSSTTSPRLFLSSLFEPPDFFTEIKFAFYFPGYMLVVGLEAVLPPLPSLLNCSFILHCVLKRPIRSFQTINQTTHSNNAYIQIVCNGNKTKIISYIVLRMLFFQSRAPCV